MGDGVDDGDGSVGSSEVLSDGSSVASLSEGSLDEEGAGFALWVMAAGRGDGDGAAGGGVETVSSSVEAIHPLLSFHRTLRQVRPSASRLPPMISSVVPSGTSTTISALVDVSARMFAPPLRTRTRSPVLRLVVVVVVPVPVLGAELVDDPGEPSALSRRPETTIARPTASPTLTAFGSAAHPDHQDV